MFRNICIPNSQRNLTKNGEQLLAALNFFVSSVNTIVNKTMEDSINTVRQYEVSRVEYDAYRSDLEYYATAPKTEVSYFLQIFVWNSRNGFLDWEPFV